MKEIYKDIDNAFNFLKNTTDDLKYERICGFSKDDAKEYEQLLKKFKETNSSSSVSTKEKGDALEAVATFLIEKSSIFNVLKNVRTTTNELDQLITLNNVGKILLKTGIINEKLENFVGECKNYQGKVSVTYVGKFCSLLQTTDTKIGILFSYYGVTGKNWSNASGLIRKFYLSKEKVKERICIIDFNIDDFENIAKGKTLLDIIEEKMLSLQYDTEYTRFLKKHYSEEYIEIKDTDI